MPDALEEPAGVPHRGTRRCSNKVSGTSHYTTAVQSCRGQLAIGDQTEMHCVTPVELHCTQYNEDDVAVPISKDQLLIPANVGC